MNIEVIGLIAGIFTTFAAVPQIIKSYKMKEVRDISLLTYLLIVIGGLLWLTYGIFSKSFALVFWNVIGTSLYSTIIIQKIYYGNKKALHD